MGRQGSGRRWASTAFYGVTGALAAMVTIAAVLAAGDRQAEFLVSFADMGVLMIDVIGLVFGVIAGFRRDLNPRIRLSWRFIAAASAMLALVSIAYAAFPDRRAFPAPGDVLRLLFIPVMLTGLLILPRASLGRRDRHKVLLDAVTVVVAGGMVMWHFVTGPALLSSGSRSAVSAVVFPIGYLVLLFGVVLVLMHGVDGSVRRPMGLLASAMVCQITANVYIAHMLAQPAHIVPEWKYCPIVLAHLLIAAAAFEQTRAANRTRHVPRSAPAVSLLPYAGVVIGTAMLLDSLVRDELVAMRLGTGIGSVVLIGLVMARQVTVLRENQRMAVTDGLTGLVNRSRLEEALSRALARSARNGRSVGVLLADLNGFKEVNDTLGHAAGDRLLTEFAGMLQRSVLGTDTVGRLGGDEFAAVLQDVGTEQNAEAVVERLREQMQTPIMIGNVAVQIRSAIGVTLSEPGESDGDALIRRADEAMYANKRLIKGGRSDGANSRGPRSPVVG